MANGNAYLNRHELAADNDERFAAIEQPPFDAPMMRGRHYAKGRTNRDGAEALAAYGIHYYERVAEAELPWNLLWHGPTQYHPRRGSFSDPENRVLTHCARMGGWLMKAADSPMCAPLRRFITKVTSCKGVNSPRTMLDLWGVVGVFNSPETATRKLCAIRQRANQMLENYGLSVSNHGLAVAMKKFRATGKGARVAALVTLKNFLATHFGMDPAQFKKLDAFFAARGLATAMKEDAPVRFWAGARVTAGEFTSLREAMQSKNRLVVDKTDGVELTLDSANVTILHGVTATLGYGVRSGGYHRCEIVVCEFLVRAGERTFHAEYREYDRKYRKADPARIATSQALEAWRKQDAATAIARKELALPDPDRVSVLVYKNDSRAVGNCLPGTEAFMCSIGVDPHRPFAGIHILLPYIEQSRVRAVVSYAVRQFGELSHA
jgi:hypothetical protein